MTELEKLHAEIIFLRSQLDILESTNHKNHKELLKFINQMALQSGGVYNGNAYFRRPGHPLGDFYIDQDGVVIYTLPLSQATESPSIA